MGAANNGAARMRPLVALRALRRLIADPEDTARVFEIIHAMAGPAQRRALRRFKQTAAGRRALAERSSLLQTLRDRETLAAMPAGTLGRAYFEFVYGESLSADGLVSASMDSDVYSFDDPELNWFGERLRDQHDLWHTLTQYGRDPFGEACLLAFTYAQGRNRGIGLIAIAAGWKLSQEIGSGVFKAMWQAYRAGQRASWLPGQDWDSLLPLPLPEMRRLLLIRPPSAYFAMRPAPAAQPA